jgi:hypothetical protein
MTRVCEKDGWGRGGNGIAKVARRHIEEDREEKKDLRVVESQSADVLRGGKSALEMMRASHYLLAMYNRLKPLFYHVSLFEYDEGQRPLQKELRSNELTSKDWWVILSSTSPPLPTNTFAIAATNSAAERVWFLITGLTFDSILNNTGASVAHSTKSKTSSSVESFVPGWTSTC